MRENTIRNIFAGYNLIFLISALGIGISGGCIQYVYNNFYYLITYRFYIIGILALLSTILTCFIFFFGCCGALYRNSCMTVTFSALLVFVLLSELCLGITGFFLLSEMHYMNQKYFMDSLYMYKAQVGMSQVWDRVQIEWDCCGVDYYEDWKKVFKNNNLPISCCRIDGSAGNVTCTQFSKDLRRKGCVNYFGNYLEILITISASLGIFFAVFQVFGIGISCYAAKIFRRFNVYR